MNTSELIKIGISVVVFILCLVGNLHFKGIIKNSGDIELGLIYDYEKNLYNDISTPPIKIKNGYFCRLFRGVRNSKTLSNIC